MKHSSQPWKKTGLCYVCGKSTKLLIHQKCGKKRDAAKNAKTISIAGVPKFSQQQQDNGIHKSTKKKYAAGYVPKFCFD